MSEVFWFYVGAIPLISDHSQYLDDEEAPLTALNQAPKLWGRMDVPRISY